MITVDISSISRDNLGIISRAIYWLNNNQDEWYEMESRTNRYKDIVIIYNWFLDNNIKNVSFYNGHILEFDDEKSANLFRIRILVYFKMKNVQ